VYFEEHQYVNNAIERENQIKKWRREKKEHLINTINPSWRDLSLEWTV
jgi:putative endonuclease